MICLRNLHFFWWCSPEWKVENKGSLCSSAASFRRRPFHPRWCSAQLWHISEELPVPPAMSTMNLSQDSCWGNRWSLACHAGYGGAGSWDVKCPEMREWAAAVGIPSQADIWSQQLQKMSASNSTGHGAGLRKAMFPTLLLNVGDFKPFVVFANSR